MPVTHAKNVTIANWSGVVTVANSTGGTTTDQASNLARPTDWNSNHAVNLSASEVEPIFKFTNGLSSTTAAGGITVGIETSPFYQPVPPLSSGSLVNFLNANAWYFREFELPYAISRGQFMALLTNGSNFLHGAVWSAASTGSVTITHTVNNNLAIYKMGSGASTTRLESVWSSNASFLATWARRLGTANTSSGTISNMLTLSFPSQFDASGGVTYGSTAQSGTRSVGASTVASTVANSLITGAGAYLTGQIAALYGMSTSLPAGVYWMAAQWGSSSSSAGTSGGVNPSGTQFPQWSSLYIAEFTQNVYKRVGLSVSNSSSMLQLWNGSYATTSTSPPQFVATSDMRNLPTPFRLYWNHAVTSY